MKSRIYSPDLLYEDFYYYSFTEKDAERAFQKFIEKNITFKGDPFDDDNEDDDDDHLDELPL